MFTHESMLDEQIEIAIAKSEISNERHEAAYYYLKAKFYEEEYNCMIFTIATVRPCELCNRYSVCAISESDKKICHGNNKEDFMVDVSLFTFAKEDGK